MLIYYMLIDKYINSCVYVLYKYKHIYMFIWGPTK